MLDKRSEDQIQHAYDRQKKAMYARTFFEELNIDSVTVAPYMGEDIRKPFCSFLYGIMVGYIHIRIWWCFVAWSA